MLLGEYNIKQKEHQIGTPCGTTNAGPPPEDKKLIRIKKKNSKIYNRKRIKGDSLGDH